VAVTRLTGREDSGADNDHKNVRREARRLPATERDAFTSECRRAAQRIVDRDWPLISEFWRGACTTRIRSIDGKSSIRSGGPSLCLAGLRLKR
jgi:hypothetical protein